MSDKTVVLAMQAADPKKALAALAVMRRMMVSRY
jgi:hypothetical protein